MANSDTFNIICVWIVLVFFFAPKKINNSEAFTMCFELEKHTINRVNHFCVKVASSNVDASVKQTRSQFFSPLYFFQCLLSLRDFRLRVWRNYFLYALITFTTIINKYTNLYSAFVACFVFCFVEFFHFYSIFCSHTRLWHVCTRWLLFAFVVDAMVACEYLLRVENFCVCAVVS